MVERIFGVVKARWSILTHAPHYSMEVQAQIPPALVALHNFILEHDSTDVELYLQEDVVDNLPGFRRTEEIDFGRLTTAEKTTRAERVHAEGTRDRIATEMWEDYQRILMERAAEAMQVDGMDMEPLD